MRGAHPPICGRPCVTCYLYPPPHVNKCSIFLDPPLSKRGVLYGRPHVQCYADNTSLPFARQMLLCQRLRTRKKFYSDKVTAVITMAAGARYHRLSNKHNATEYSAEYFKYRHLPQSDRRNLKLRHLPRESHLEEVELRQSGVFVD